MRRRRHLRALLRKLIRPLRRYGLNARPPLRRIISIAAPVSIAAAIPPASLYREIRAASFIHPNST
jgi:hypothetical protein